MLGKTGHTRASSSDEYTRIEGLTTQLISDSDTGPTTYDSTVYGEFEMAESSSFNSSLSFDRGHGEMKRRKKTGRNVAKYFRRCDACCGPVQPNRFREFMWGIFSSRLAVQQVQHAKTKEEHEKQKKLSSNNFPGFPTIFFNSLLFSIIAHNSAQSFQEVE